MSGLIFGGLRLINPNATLMVALAVLLTAGTLLGACYMLTGRLWWSMGMHFAWNFMQSGVLGLAVSGNLARPGLFQSYLAGPAWLTGGEIGPEASLVAITPGFGRRRDHPASRTKGAASARSLDAEARLTTIPCPLANPLAETGSGSGAIPVRRRARDAVLMDADCDHGSCDERHLLPAIRDRSNQQSPQ